MPLLSRTTAGRVYRSSCLWRHLQRPASVGRQWSKVSRQRPSPSPRIAPDSRPPALWNVLLPQEHHVLHRSSRPTAVRDPTEPQKQFPTQPSNQSHQDAVACVNDDFGDQHSARRSFPARSARGTRDEPCAVAFRVGAIGAVQLVTDTTTGQSSRAREYESAKWPNTLRARGEACSGSRVRLARQHGV